MDDRYIYSRTSSGETSNEDRENRARAHYLLMYQGDPKFYLFSYLRDDSPGLLAHFLRWYGAAGIDFTRSRFVIHGVQTPPGSATDAERTAKVFQDYRVPQSSLRYVSSYSSQLKTAAVNEYLSELPLEAWLVYPDLDEFFAYPCYWGGRVLPLVDHMARQSVDGPMAASIVADTSSTRIRLVATIGRNDAPLPGRALAP